MSVGAIIPGKLTNFDIIGHMPREMTRFCHYFVNYREFVEARVRESKYRPSPMPNGGLKISMLSLSKKVRAPEKLSKKWEKNARALY